MESKLTRIQKVRHALEDLRWDEMQFLADSFGRLTNKRDKPTSGMNVRWATYRAEETAADLAGAVATTETHFLEQDQVQEGE